MSVEELETVVAKLPPEQLSRFTAWFQEFLADEWDRRIEADVLAGRLDEALQREDDHYHEGRVTPL